MAPKNNLSTVAISEKQQVKGLFRIGDMLEGTAWTKKYEEREYADYYRAGSVNAPPAIEQGASWFSDRRFSVRSLTQSPQA